MKVPQQVVRITGSVPLVATVYEMQWLRCNLFILIGIAPVRNPNAFLLNAPCLTFFALRTLA